MNETWKSKIIVKLYIYCNHLLIYFLKKAIFKTWNFHVYLLIKSVNDWSLVDFRVAGLLLISVWLEINYFILRVGGHNKSLYIKLEIRMILMSLKWKISVENIRIELTVINTNYIIKINKSDIFCFF